MKTNKLIYLFIIVSFAILILLNIFVIFILLNRDNKPIKIDTNVIDTLRIYEVKDSINYIIKQKDSTIINIKTKYKYEIEKTITLTDSAAVEQFLLLSADTINKFPFTGEEL